MKKWQFGTALMVGLALGVASPALAAPASPFSDVPSDFWAYDAVAELAQDGIINGYGDSTFRGDRKITRYEMAQMVAKAVAREDQANAQQKALIDKLAAEFSTELNNLGVRVQNLEQKTDNVKWMGLMEDTWTSARHHQIAGSDGQQYEYDTKDNDNDATFRFEPEMKIKDHWMVKARIDSGFKWNTDEAKNSGHTTLERAYVEGNYDNLRIRVGKIPNDIAMIAFTDYPYSGAEVTYGKDWKFTLAGGRANDPWDDTFSPWGTHPYSIDTDTWNNLGGHSSEPADYIGVGIAYTGNESKLTGAVNYLHFKDKDFENTYVYTGPGYYHNRSFDRDSYHRGGSDKASIWTTDMTYRFDPNVAVKGEYAYNSEADNYNKAASLEVDYKGTKNESAGSWGAYLAYRHLGKYGALDSTYSDGVDTDQKGWEVGASYMVAKNILAIIKYFDGKDITTDTNAKKLFGRFDFFF